MTESSLFPDIVDVIALGDRIHHPQSTKGRACHYVDCVRRINVPTEVWERASVIHAQQHPDSDLLWCCKEHLDDINNVSCTIVFEEDGIMEIIHPMILIRDEILLDEARASVALDGDTQCIIPITES